MGIGVILRGPHHIELERYEDPPLGPDQVRIRTLYSGISTGTERTAYRGSNPYQHKAWDPALRLFHQGGEPSKPYPVRDLGYEEVGEIVEVGAAVNDLVPGQRTYGTWHHRSSHVADAAYVRPRLLPDALPTLAGIFSHIGATALNGVHDAGIRIGETACVFGLGVPGQIAAQLARGSGARVIGVDPNPARLAAAERAGALDVAIGGDEQDVAERIKHLTDGRGADVALEVSGAIPALGEAIRCVAYAARVVALGFYQGTAAGLALGEEFHHNRVELVSSQISAVAPARSYRWTRLRLAQEVMRLQVEGTLALVPLVTHRYPVAEAAEAFRLLDEAPWEPVQVVLDFTDDGELHERGDPT